MEKYTHQQQQQQQKGSISGGKGQSSKSKGAAAPLPEDMITIVVKAQDGREIFYKISGEMKMKKLMAHYCTRRGLQYETVRFFIDGKKVDPKKTASQLELEDGDSIDAMLEQLGGGQA